MVKYWMVGIGGFLGAIARFWLDGFVSERLGTVFPYGTFLVNCTGSFLIGLVVTLFAERAHWNPNWRYLIAIGFIGAYTTFSTFEYETLRTIESSEFLIGGLYVGLSVVVGFVAVWLGVVAGRLLP